jgi:hypothetical protein
MPSDGSHVVPGAPQHGSGSGQQFAWPLASTMQPHDAGSSAHGSLQVVGSIGSVHGGVQPGAFGSSHPPPQLGSFPLQGNGGQLLGSVIGSHGVGGSQFGSPG